MALERGVLKAFCFQKEKELASIHILLLKLRRVKSPSGKRGDIREQRAGGDTCQKENDKEECVTLELHPDQSEVSEVCFLSVVGR